ncbi:glutamine-hydrolyzing GMP synthase [soil metagenome]
MGQFFCAAKTSQNYELQNFKWIVVKKTDLILILDFGSQYSQLIARRIREMNVYCEIHPFNFRYDEKNCSNYNLKGVILSGGPSSVTDKKSPTISKNYLDELSDKNIPVLAICYGMQLVSKLYGGKIHKSLQKEYGNTKIQILEKSGLFSKIPISINVWMSHGDSIDRLPSGFDLTAKTSNGIFAAAANEKCKVYLLQFHPEVEHTKDGRTIFSNFIFKICKVKLLFKKSAYIRKKVEELKSTIGDKKVICALSGGVDSSVAAVLVHKAIGKNLICIHVDNGLMRKNESKNIVKLFRKSYKINVKLVIASEIFINRLKGVSDPEKKRKIIGKTFIDVFENEALKISGAEFLLQGTLYPDVIESVSFKGPSAVIKTHHNVGGLPKKMKFKLVEPFRELFKDEVREIGNKLKIPSQFIKRHPFPGPGLAIRILSDVNQKKLDILKSADDIYINYLIKHKLYDKIWQAFCVLMPVNTVGVMGDERIFGNVLGIRAVTSIDGMTADFFEFTHRQLSEVSNELINKVKGINRVVLDISSKPPATIEWE